MKCYMSLLNLVRKILEPKLPLKMIQLKMFILRINSGPEKLRDFLKVIQLLHGRASNAPPSPHPTMYYLQPCAAAFSPYCTKDVHVYSPLSILCIIYYSYSVTIHIYLRMSAGHRFNCSFISS